MRTSWVARIGPVALARLPRTHTGPSPTLSVAEAKPSFVPAIGQPERRPLVEVGEQLARPHLRRAGVARLDRERLARRERLRASPCPTA